MFKAIETDPEKRFQTARELKQALDSFAGESRQKENRSRQPDGSRNSEPIRITVTPTVNIPRREYIRSVRRTNRIGFSLGSFALLAVLLVTGHPVISGIAANWPLVVYAGIVVTGIGYFFYFKGIEESDATTGSMAFFIKPAIAPVFAIIILHETVLWNTVVGIILLISASAITIRDKFRKH